VVNGDETGRDQRVRLRAGILSLVVGTTLLGCKYVAYLATGSAAVLSDALESITNVVAALFALGGLVFAGRPADRGHPYGHGKIEYFTAVFEGGLISFAAFVIVWYAVSDLVRGPAVGAVELGLAITAAAGAVNAALGWYLVRTGRRARSMTLVADGQHVLSDFWTSLVVAGNLGLTGFRLVRRAAGGLLDEEDSDLLMELVRAFDASRQPGIIRIHRLRAIRSGRLTHVDAHLIVPEYWTVEQAHDATDAFERRVIDSCTIEGEIIFHTDPCRRSLCSICEVSDCPVRQGPFAARPPLTVEEATLTDESFWRQRADPTYVPGRRGAATLRRR
jgi:divalent metal cation (Fe/Co/Zn/Cd) transporter